MRILLTGATGLIGKEVGKRLVESGHHVLVAARSAEKARADLPFPAEVFAWSSVQSQFPIEALNGVDAIIHLAGEPVADGRWTNERKKRIRDSRVEGTKRIVDAVSKLTKKPKVFICGSAIGFYGNRGDEVLDESSAQGKGFLADLVRDWEAQTAPLEGKGTRIVHLRTGLVFSRRGGALAKLLPIFAKGLGGKLGSGAAWMSWIHITDIVSAILFCLDHELASGAVNATAPEPVRNERFTVAFARALKRSVFLPVPEAALKMAMGEASSAVLASARVMPRKLEEMGFEFKFRELVPALEELAEPLIGGQHELVAEQWVPKSPSELFPYFCSETNLEALTPPFLNFRVTGKSTPEIAAGTLIDYRMSLHGIPVKWRTQIEMWDPGRSFVDNQLSGPYSKWHHTHEFIPLAGGTLMRDRVLYKLPLGFLGDAFAGWKVSRDVSEIFAFRRKKIIELFGSHL
jgi:uncharacterized protein (TIGR01777 family)